MRLLSQHSLDGFGNCGEGMAIQLTRTGRRVLWLAHESAPKNVTAVDVTDPRQAAVILQTDLPHGEMRSNSLDLVGDILVVAYQTSTPGPDARRLRDLRRGRSRQPAVGSAFFDASGPGLARRAPPVVRRRRVRPPEPRAPPTSRPATRRTTSATASSTCASPRKPAEVGRWWLPGTRDGDAEPPPPRHPKFDTGFRAHNTNVYPQRPDRAYVGYLDGGAIILDIADMGAPAAGRPLGLPPAVPGLHPHAAAALRSRAARGQRRVDRRRRRRLAEARVGPRRARRDQPGADQHLPAAAGRRPSPGAAAASAPTTCTRTGRRRASWISETIVVGTFFNGGVRAFDLSDPFRPARGRLLRAAGAPQVAERRRIQLNDVFVDERGVLYTVDRFDRRALRVRAEGVGLVNRGGTRPGDRGRALSAPARSSAHRAMANGQRGWNRQPEGGLIGDGTSPVRMISSRSMSGCDGQRGREQRLGVRVQRVAEQLLRSAPARRSCPRYITATSWAM